MEYRWPGPSRAFARAVARRTRTVARPRGTLPVSVVPVPSCQPELTELSRATRGAERGPCVREAARHRRACRESPTRARKDTAREEKRERGRPSGEDSDGRRKREIARGGGRDRDEEKRGREESERAPPPPPSGLPRVRPSVCNDQEDGLTGPSVWPFDTRCVDRLADDELSGAVSARYCRAARRRR